MTASEAIQAFCREQCRKRLAATVADCEHRKCQLWEFRGNEEKPEHAGFLVGEIVIYDGKKYKIGSFNCTEFPEAMAHLRTGCTGEWVPVRCLERWIKSER